MQVFTRLVFQFSKCICMLMCILVCSHTQDILYLFSAMKIIFKFMERRHPFHECQMLEGKGLSF